MDNDTEASPQSPLKKPDAPPTRPPGVLERPIDLGRLDAPFDLDACREFLSFSGGSILYCLSAMCVIYGIAAVLGPIFARTYVLGETLPCIVGLNVYEIALFAVLLVIVVWQDVTDDAISLVVLSGVFLVVSGVALTTTSNSNPRAALLIGACGFALSMGKVFVLRRFIGMSISPLLWAGLAVVLGWNFLAGARLAEFAAAKDVGREQWLVSWLVLLAGGVIVLLDAALRRPESAERAAPGRCETPDASGVRVPFLRQPAMSWIFALVLLAAACVHQHALAYVFAVRSGVIDYLPFVCVLSLIFVQLALHLRRQSAWLAAGLAAVPLAAFLVALTEGPVIEKPALAVGLLGYPPVFLGLTGVAVLLTGIRRGCRALLAVVPCYALGVALTLRFSAATPGDLHWSLAGVLVVTGLFALGLVRRNAALCVAAVVIGTAGFAATRAFEGFAHSCGLDGAGAALGLAGMGTLAVALLFGRMNSAVLVAAALGVMVCAFDFLPSTLGAKDLVAAFALGALGAGVRMRLGHWPSVVILGVPVAWRLAVASARLGSWRYVLFGFVLLFVGAWVSVRKGKRARCDAARIAEAGPAPATDPPPRATQDSSSAPPGA